MDVPEPDGSGSLAKQYRRKGEGLDETMEEAKNGLRWSPEDPQCAGITHSPNSEPRISKGLPEV